MTEPRIITIPNLAVRDFVGGHHLMGDKADKYETLRRLRFGDLRRLLQHRWGYVLPDDDAGRGDLWLLVTNCSLAAAEPEKKMAHVIEVWAPWMTPDELAAYVQHVWGLDLYQRIQTARELGEQLGLAQCHAGSSQAVAVPANRQNRRRACRAASGQAPREGSDQASSEEVPTKRRLPCLTAEQTAPVGGRRHQPTHMGKKALKACRKCVTDNSV